MFALLRLHALQLRKLLGLWGLTLIAAICAYHWLMNWPESDRLLALLCHLFVAPLALVAALRGDLFTWTLPLRRGSRLASQILFTLTISFVGAAGSLALLRLLGNAVALPLATLGLRGAIAAFVLGSLYLLIEESQAILGGLVLFAAVAIDIGLSWWQLTQPYTSEGLYILIMFAGISVIFYSIIYLQGESLLRDPLTEGAPTLPPTPNTPKLVWPGKADSMKAQELLKVSRELRKGRSLLRILLLKDLWAYSIVFLFQLVYMCLISYGAIMIQQIAINVTIQMSASVKRWSYFAHTPLPRVPVMSIATAPWLAFWVLTSAACIASTFIHPPHFLSDRLPDNPRGSYASAYIRPNPELAINNETLGNFGLSTNIADWPQDPSRMSENLARFLERMHGVKTTPDELLSLHPGTLPVLLVEGKDPRQIEWMAMIQERFQTSLTWSLFRRRIYDCLLALLLSCCVLWGMITVGSRRNFEKVLTSVVIFFTYMIPSFPNFRIPFFSFCDALPWLTVAILIGLSALTFRASYRAFQEWTPVTIRKPTHLRIR